MLPDHEHVGEALHGAAGLVLPGYARECIREALGGPTPLRPLGAAFDEPAAAFVTLHRGGRLHGCIGSIEPRRALADDVRQNAIAAAFYDPRARHLDPAEVDELEIEVSVLSPLTPIVFYSEAEALSLLHPHVDGVVLSFRHHHGTFLPQVWESLPDPAEFLANLKLKAGLPPDFWAPDLELERFTVTKWTELARSTRVHLANA